MFSAAAQGEPRRQSYKSFTRGLLNASELEEAAAHRANHPELEPVPEEGAWTHQTRARLPTSSSGQTHLSASGSTNSLSTTGSNAHLASASLILGEAASLHPKLPRVMSNAVPSYAYGAPSTNKERPTHTRAPRGSLGGDEGSVDGRSSRRGGKSKPRDNDDDAGSGSASLLAGGNDASPEAASVRYARLKQRIQNTGSSSVPDPPASSAMPPPGTTVTKSSSTGTIRKNPKPNAVGSRDTSVNLAVAIQHAEARKKAALASASTSKPADPGSSTLDQPSFQDGSYEMEVDLRDPDATASTAHVQDGEDGSAVKETHTISPHQDGDTSLTGSKKRKKGRKSGHVVLDPTYKYRPDDEFSSDSEAGEGLAGGKAKRNAKVPDRTLPGEGSGLWENKRPKKKPRKSGEVARDDSETGSDVDTGVGIAKSRPRRSLANPNGSGEGSILEEYATAAHQARPKATPRPRPRTATDDDGGDYVYSDDQDEDDVNPSARSSPRRRRRSAQDANATANGSTTYFVSGPVGQSSSLSPISSPHAKAVDKSVSADLLEKGDSFGEAAEGASYSYEEEERMVRALEEEEERARQRQLVEKAVAREQAEQRKPKLPVGQALSAPPAYIRPPVGGKGGWGYKLGRKVRTVIGAFQAIRWWHLALVGLLVAFLMSSESSYPFLRRPRRAAYVAPSMPPGSVEELIDRLAMVEKAVGALSTVSDVEQARLDDAHRVSSVLERRVVDLEADSTALSLRTGKEFDRVGKGMEKDLKSLQDATRGIKAQLDRLGLSVKDLDAARQDGRSDLANLQRGVDRTTKDVADLGGKLDRVEKEVARALDRDRIVRIALDAVEDRLPAQMAVRIDRSTGKLHIDPVFWSHLRSAFAEKGSSGAPSTANPSGGWDEFLVQNERTIRGWLDDDFDRRAKSGAAVSRQTFLEVLKRELTGLQAELEKSADEHYHRLGAEIAKSAAAAAAGASKGGDKPVVIKSSDGRQINDVLTGLIDAALVRYSKDTLGRQDFALYTAGARVIPAMTSETYNFGPSTFLGRLVGLATGAGKVIGRPPVTALHPDVSVGMCWAIQGARGQLGISLSREVVPTDVTIEHAPADLAPDVSSAPRGFQLWGFVERPEDLERLKSYREAHPDQEGDGGATSAFANDMLLATGTYTPSSTHFIQTVPVNAATAELAIPVRIVMLKVDSNHGNPHTTCLYRLRVHGDIFDPSSSSTAAA